ncbi:hypothetical protein AX17_002483 [Amanita inopinata Kibby_2008]|nr:hypothetical protein AX17_002483 [Amanita inopinata Kibby_2008]
MIFGILYLAPELIERISEEAVGSRRSLRATCRELNRLVEPQLFARILIDIKSNGIDMTVRQLHGLAYSSLPIARHAKRVAIGSLSHLQDTRFIVGQGDDREDERVNRANALLREYLEPALMAMKNVQGIVWALYNDNPTWAKDTVLRSLTSYSQLQELGAGFRERDLTQSNLYFPSLSNLKKIRISNIPAHHSAYPQIVEHVAQTIGRSPDLFILEIRAALPSKAVTPPNPTLHSFLARLQPGAVLPLRHLTLVNWHVRLDAGILPHFRNLVSLTLRKNLLPRESSPLAEQEHTFYSTDEHLIFEELLSSQIHLRELATDSISTAFIKYLSSYKGIKRLELTRCTFTDQTSCDRLADEFYVDALPNHCDSIEILRVETAYASRWSFGEGASRCLAKCEQLRWLTIDINDTTEGVPHFQQLDVMEMRQTVGSLLRFSSRQPALTCLTITPAFKNGPFTTNTLFSAVSEGLDNLLYELVEGYGSIDLADSSKYPIVEVGWPTSRMQVRTVDGGLRFVPL